MLSFQATAPATAGTYTWGTAVGTYPGLNWLNLALTGPPPTTTVYANPAASLVVSGLPTGPVTAGTPFSADGHRGRHVRQPGQRLPRHRALRLEPRRAGVAPR